jgi:hypothetical protein
LLSSKIVAGPLNISPTPHSNPSLEFFVDYAPLQERKKNIAARRYCGAEVTLTQPSLWIVASAAVVRTKHWHRRQLLEEVFGGY